MGNNPWTVAQVRRGLQLIDDGAHSRFALGDLAEEVAPTGDDTSHNGSLDTLRSFAAELGISFEQLRKYRHVSQAWPKRERKEIASWSVYRELTSVPNASEVLATLYAESKAAAKSEGKRVRARVTVDQARRHRGAAPTRDQTSADAVVRIRREAPAVEERLILASAMLADDDLDAERTAKAALVSQLVADPAVAQEVAHDMKVSQALEAAKERRIENVDRKVRETIPTESSLLDVDKALSRARSARHQLDGLVVEMRAIGRAEITASGKADRLRADIDRISFAAEAAKHYLDGESGTLADEVAAYLEGIGQ